MNHSTQAKRQTPTIQRLDFIIIASIIVFGILIGTTDFKHQHTYQLEALAIQTDNLYVFDTEQSLDDCTSQIADYRVRYGTTFSFHCTIDPSDRHYNDMIRKDRYYLSN